MPLDSLLDAVTYGPVPRPEPQVSLLSEIRRLPVFWDLKGESEDKAIRILYRLGEILGQEEYQSGIIDLFRRSRWEGSYEALIKLRLVRKYKFPQLAAERFADYLHDFKYTMLNLDTLSYTHDPALKRILDNVDLDSNDELVLGSEG
jgi:hypothetical protein